MTDTSHGALMDDVYRYQRLFYDVTRKYYLLGRDHLIENMGVTDGQSVLEVACGTGRNLATIGRRYRRARLFGFDISEQMLTTARAKLGARATLAQGDACAFDPAALFGEEKLDHIVLSYSISMIPDWERALAEAMTHLAPGGTLHVVDFGDQAGLPGWFKSGLLAWLAKFHVSPRDAEETLRALAQTHEATLTFCPLYRGYAQYARITA